MGTGENEAFMEDFGDTLNDEADWQTKTGRNAAEALDTSLQAPNANDFSNARLIEEVSINRFIQESGLVGLLGGRVGAART